MNPTSGRSAAADPPRPAASPGRRYATPRRLRHRRLAMLAFLAPALLLYSGFLVYPLASTFSYSFFDWHDTLRGGFIGIQNYHTLFTSYPLNEQLGNAFVHNCVLFVGTMVVQNTTGLGFAVLLHRLRSARRLFQILYTLPYLVNPLVVGYLWTLLLNPTYGPINALLNEAGLHSLAKPWLGDPSTALLVVIAVGAWQWLGFPVLLFGAALGSIPGEYAEAARVDGASSWAVFRRIQLPLLTPAIRTLTVLSLIWSFNTFGLAYGLGGSSGGPAGSTDVLGLVFYRTAFEGGSNRIGISSAMAVLMFALIFSIAMTVERMLRRREITLR
jgi:raffinose/stachyose/melibiose transport system permease protein